MKFFVCVCAVLAVAAATESKKDKRGIYGESLGYGSLGLGGLDHGLGYAAPLSLGPSLSLGYSAPLYSKSLLSSPVITKTVLPAPIYKTVLSAPAPIVKTVIAPSPIIKTYASAPLIKSYSAPIIKSYAAAPLIKSYAAPISLGHGYGLGDLSLGGHGLAYSSGLELGHGW